MGGGNGEGMGGLLTDEEISKHQVNNIILSSSCMLTNYTHSKLYHPEMLMWSNYDEV